jgi:hypothetical protein
MLRPSRRVAAVLVAVPLALFYREPLADAWKRADAGSSS